MAGPGQRRAQGAFFVLLTAFFAGITLAAFAADTWQKWPIVIAAAALTLWMGSLAVRMLRAARRS